MKKLQEIVRVVGRKRLRRIEVFNEAGGGTNRSSLYYRFYRGIKEQKYTTDEEAARDLCGTDPTDKKYLMLKSRVRARLINTLFFLDQTTTRYEAALYKCNRNLVAAKFLLQGNARYTATSMLRSTYNEAEKYGLTAIAIDCLRHLRYGASLNGQEALYRQYNERFKELQRILAAEDLAEGYYQEITLPFARSSANIPQLSQTAFAHLQEIEELRSNLSSFNLELQYFRLRIMAHQIATHYREVLAAAEEGEAFLKEHADFVQQIRFGEFAFYKMAALLHLGEYEKGKSLANRSLNYYPEGSLNWMLFLEYYFLLCMHTGNYDKAAEVYKKVTEHPRFEMMNQVRKEKWKIFEAFLTYMMQDVLQSDNGQFTQKFKVWKFMNEVPIFSRDKRGLNIAILVLQVLFLLDRGDFDGIIQRAEALKVYASRYLKQDENFRSNCFLKMVLLMEKKDFNYERTRKTSEKYYHKLQTSRFDYKHGSLATLEIIPYEHLWQTILEKLRRQSYSG
ncbi:MAG: hypothetical protein AAGN35_25925 [Bacteroidota bacterium]